MADLLPKTLETAVRLIAESIDPDEYQKTRELALKSDLNEMAGRVHHSLGRFFRNELNLWDESSAELKKSIWESLAPERRKFYMSYWAQHNLSYEGENMHADDASHELLVATLQHIKGSP